MAKTTVEKITLSHEDVQIAFSNELKPMLQAAFWKESQTNQDDFEREAKALKIGILNLYAKHLFERGFNMRYTPVLKAREKSNKELVAHIMLYHKKTEQQARQMLGIADVEYVPPTSEVDETPVPTIDFGV